MTEGFVPQGGFDARSVEPKQGVAKHPVGNFPFMIKTTDIVGAQDGKSGMLRVTFESPAGQIDKNYSLWHDNAKTVEIAQAQLSALCHVTGIYQFNWANKGRELVNARGTMEVGWQKGDEPSAEKPQGGYVEVKKVFDQQGNEPGKVNAAPAPQQANAGWGNQGQAAQQQQPQQNNAPMQQQPQGGGWAQPQQNAPQQQQAPQQGGGWSQAPQNNGNAPAAPWGQR